MQTQRKCSISIFIVLAFCLISAGCGSKTGLQSKIQQEFDSNPFLKEQKIKLTVVKEENGYVTVEIDGYSDHLLTNINKGNDIFDNTISAAGFQSSYKDEIKDYNAVKTAIEAVKKIKGVKVISLAVSPEGLCSLGSSSAIKGKYAEAASLYQQAADRGSLYAKERLAGYYCSGRGGLPRDYSKAIELYNEVLKKDNKRAICLYCLAWIYGTCENPQYRDGQKSLEYALQAYSIKPDEQGSSCVLAAAYAASGNFEKAVQEQYKCMNEAKKINYSPEDFKRKVLNTIEKQLALYNAHQPYVEEPGDVGGF